MRNILRPEDGRETFVIFNSQRFNIRAAASSGCNGSLERQPISFGTGHGYGYG